MRAKNKKKYAHVGEFDSNRNVDQRSRNPITQTHRRRKVSK